MPSEPDKNEKNEQAERGNSFYAALARTLTRSAALYFSRPVRLFRPSKVSGWMFLQGLASKKGVPLSPQFVKHLVKKQGLFVLPRHFIPPIAVNALLGTVLWTSYSEASSFLKGRLQHPLAVSLVSGAVAGGTQAVVAAPAENVRFVIENGSSHSGWVDAWKDVFRGSQSEVNQTKTRALHEARQVRLWMKEVGEMAGRGWEGFGWGFAKDVFGFAVFFSIFELTRRISIAAKAKSMQMLQPSQESIKESRVPRIVHATSLVTGGILAGLSYDLTTRPFDQARRVIHAQHVIDPGHRTVVAGLRALGRKVQDEGLIALFRNIHAHDSMEASEKPKSKIRRRLYSTLRFLGRMGPWGVGFLIWETYGPGLVA